MLLIKVINMIVTVVHGGRGPDGDRIRIFYRELEQVCHGNFHYHVYIHGARRETQDGGKN